MWCTSMVYTILGHFFVLLHLNDLPNVCISVDPVLLADDKKYLYMIQVS